ncbi:MAG: DUF554 domain-containing protein [Actinomycetia bacterium]|nr:DUF554 domain-containing protein [Actinomycetes bacterium]
MPGLGTLINVAAVLFGGTIGTLLGDRLPARVRDVVTDGLGLVTLMVGGLNVAAVLDPELVDEVGRGVPLLIVLASVVIGGIVGAVLQLESRIEGLGATLQRRLAGGQSAQVNRRRFIEGYVTASLVFCVGPLTVLGSLQDGIGDGIELLTLKSVLDGIAALAFAASLGWGVVASALTVLVVQGTLTAFGAVLGEVMTDAQVAALSATGGVLLLGVGLRLLRLKPLPVGDLLPALLVAPLLTALLGTFLDS